LIKAIVQPLTVVLLVGGCQGGKAVLQEWPEKQTMTDKPGVSMLLQNYGAPFIDQKLGAGIARLLVNNKYPPDIFLAEDNVIIEDAGEFWKITLKNQLRVDVDRPYVTKSVRVTIKKSNGEILEIS
jgi:hypothetical protein